MTTKIYDFDTASSEDEIEKETSPKVLLISFYFGRYKFMEQSMTIFAKYLDYISKFLSFDFNEKTIHLPICKLFCAMLNFNGINITKVNFINIYAETINHFIVPIYFQQSITLVINNAQAYEFIQNDLETKINVSGCIPYKINRFARKIARICKERTIINLIVAVDRASYLFTQNILHDTLFDKKNTNQWICFQNLMDFYMIQDQQVSR